MYGLRSDLLKSISYESPDQVLIDIDTLNLSFIQASFQVDLIEICFNLSVLLPVIDSGQKSLTNQVPDTVLKAWAHEVVLKAAKKG